jgi:hypothetical protein
MSERLNAALGVRRLHLVALDAVIVDTPDVVAGLVVRGQGPPVLRVYPADAVARCLDGRAESGERVPGVDVGCCRLDGCWWYVREPCGERLARVDAVLIVPGMLAHLLGVAVEL